MTTIGMESHIPEQTRALVMIVALIEGVPFTPEQREVITRKLSEARVLEERKMRRSQRRVITREACRNANHPESPCRVTDKVFRKGGKNYTYEHCLERARITEKARRWGLEGKLCQRCQHPTKKHDDIGCQHHDPKTMQLDCECAPITNMERYRKGFR